MQMTIVLDSSYETDVDNLEAITKALREQINKEKKEKDKLMIKFKNGSVIDFGKIRQKRGI